MNFIKKAWLPTAVALISLASCKENGPVIDFGTILATDTTYMATAPAPQPRAFLIEDFSGIKCVNCPAAHDFVSASEAQYPGRIIPMTIHIFAPGNSTSEPHFNITPLVDFRTQDGTGIFSNIYQSPSSLPTIGISRTQQNGSIRIQNGTQQLQSLASTPTLVNIALASLYDAGSNKSIVKVVVSYTGAVSKKQTLTVALVQDDIPGPQDAPDLTTGLPQVINPYTHNHILRKIYTAPTGTAMIDSIATKAPGRVYERTFNVDVDPSWFAPNCKIVAFVANNEPGDKEVLQAAEIKLKP